MSFKSPSPKPHLNRTGQFFALPRKARPILVVFLFLPFSLLLPQKGQILLLLPFKNQRTAKGAGGKGPRQKTSKIVKKCQRYFRHFSTFFAQGKKRQKSPKSFSKSFSTLFDKIIARHQFSGPFWGALKKGKKLGREQGLRQRFIKEKWPPGSLDTSSP